MSEDKIIIGKFLSTFGIKGDLEIELEFEEDVDFYIKNLKQVYLQNKRTKEFKAFNVIFKKDKGKILCHIKGIDSPEMAKSFCNATVFASLKDLPKKEDSLYLFELFGKEVKLEDGKTIGKLTNIFKHGNTDYLEIDYGKYLIPAKEPFLVKLDENDIVISEKHFLI
ncbi:ribosome maturation factor RimM [Hydrogenobaculum acidophilum]